MMLTLDTTTGNVTAEFTAPSPLHVIFTPEGIPGHISDDPRLGSEPVEGLDIAFLAAHRRLPDGTWVARDPVVPAPPAPPPEPAAEDFTLTRFQLRMGLLTQFGITADQIAQMIGQIPNAVQRELARISWEDATEYRFTHPLITQIAGALALPDAAVRQAWVKSARNDFTPAAPIGAGEPIPGPPT